jgi:ASC-1-like (ASCH) protein
MAEKNATILLSKVLVTPDGKSTNKKYIDIIMEAELPILCINNKTKKERLMPFKVLFDNHENFYSRAGDWAYYLTGEYYEKLKELAIEKIGAWDLDRPKQEAKPQEAKKETPPHDYEEELEELPIEVGYGKEYKQFAEMTTQQKIEYLDKDRQKLNELLNQKTKNEEAITEALVNTTKDAALINHAALQDVIGFSDAEAKEKSQTIVDSTNEMIKTSAQLMMEDVFSNDLMNTLVEKSNGTVVQHMTRVYLNGVAFLTYYNKLVTTSSAIQKLRISFTSKYRDFYHALIPHIPKESINLERVFLGGMRVVTPELFYKWSVGFLIHDIGKAAAVEYHEGESKYDRNIVIDHVKHGYKSIMTKTNYPMEASLITGYHHEYYGDASGYGYFRAYLQQYKRQNPDARQDYCITFELEPMMDYKALAYFPAKVLEIIDVYDSVTDPNRVYRKAMSPEEALTMMREEFLDKSRKVDPIIFDIFSSFIREKLQRQKS